MSSVLISPSILNADFCELGATIELLNKSQADYIHLDIMDGKFVPNISFGIPIVASIRKHSNKPLDVHLMIEQPDLYLTAFKEAGADILTVHYEACNHLHRTLQSIKNLGIKSGIALNPHTPASVLEEILPFTDMVLIMSVNPGFGGQSFISQSINKIERLREMANLLNPNLIIEVDGGVDNSNAAQLIKAGTNMLVAGSYILNSDNPAQTIAKLKSI
jgi:ribulose-phosphate 3-epimerase